MKTALTIALTILIATSAGADPLTGKTAKKLLFAPDAAEAEMLPGSGLSEQDQTVLKSVAEAQPYYGAIAISPDEGLMSEATVAAADYHDTAAAEAVALAECNAKKTGAAPCVTAALIRPKGWEAREVQLSQTATTGYRDDYAGKGGALAVSAATGAWGIGKGYDAALTACAGAEGKVTDCAVLIAD